MLVHPSLYVCCLVSLMEGIQGSGSVPHLPNDVIAPEGMKLSHSRTFFKIKCSVAVLEWEHEDYAHCLALETLRGWRETASLGFSPESIIAFDRGSAFCSLVSIPRSVASIS